MPLTPGTRLGVYEITTLLGEGGMGQVYRATDTTLGRQVAIKILPGAFAADPERLARFEREAKTLASLNHPYIGAIYAVEKSAGVHALVMELVEGEDLSQRIARGALPIDDALPIAKQIADALEAAHDQGIVHRDLKPANIKVRADGTVKVLDFGLAKALAPAEGASATADAMNSPTMTAAAFATGYGGPGTEMGMILGTAAYMAPEQAKGRAVDRRADIWAFGVVLHEMLTGRRLFEAEDISETLAAVLTRDVSVTALPAGVPPRLRTLVRDCLIRDPKQRLRDIGEARRVLDKIIAGSPDDMAATLVAPAVIVPMWRRAIPIAAAVIVTAVATLALAAAAGVWMRTHSATDAAATSIAFQVMPPDGGAFVDTAETANLALSSDGSQLAYVASDGSGVSRVWIKTSSSAEPQAQAGTEGARHVFWAPNGKSLAFAVGGKLMQIDLPGGKLSTIATVSGDPIPIAEPVRFFRPTGAATFSASRSGVLAYQSHSDRGRLVWLDELGNETGAIGDDSGYSRVRLSPDGSRVLFTHVQPLLVKAEVWSYDFDRKVPPDRVTSDQSVLNPVWLPGGRTFLFSGGIPLHLRSHDLVSGEERDLLTEDREVMLAEDVSPTDRTLVFTQRRGGSFDMWTTPIDDMAKRTVYAETSFDEASVRFSRNGHFLAYASNELGTYEVFVAPYPRADRPIRVSTHGGSLPRWSPDGRKLFYLSGDGWLTLVPVTTTPSFRVVGEPRRLFAVKRGALWADIKTNPSWPDYDVSLDGKHFLAVIPLPASEKPVTVLTNWRPDSRNPN